MDCSDTLNIPRPGIGPGNARRCLYERGEGERTAGVGGDYESANRRLGAADADANVRSRTL